MYYTHYNDGAMRDKYRRLADAIADICDTDLPANVSVLKNGIFTQIACNLCDSKNIFLSRNKKMWESILITKKG